MKSYIEYLSEVLFEDIELEDLTVEKLMSLEVKNGVSIIGQDSVSVALMRKFEPMEFLDTAIIFEKVKEFIVIDPFGYTMYEGSAEDIIGFTEGFYNGEKEWLIWILNFGRL